MDTEEKIRVLKWELIEQGYAQNTAMTILIQEKIDELEQRRIGEIAHRAIRERNARVNSASH